MLGRTHSSKSSKKCSPTQVVAVLFILVVSIMISANFYFRYTISNNDVNIDATNNDNLRNNKIKISEELVHKGDTVKVTTSPINTLLKKKIAYAITVTKDGPFVDGALVLGYAALKIHNESKGFKTEYTADLIAFVVPSVTSSRKILESYGWKIFERRLPVELDDIENKAYANSMKNSGCCGADEFLKLWAYTLTDYHRVVHLDMDSIIYQNMV